MASISIVTEETPRYKGAPSTSPYRVSSDRFWLPVSAGSIAASPSHLDRTNEARGLYSPAPRLIEGYAPAGRLTIRGYLNELAPLLNAAGLTATITQGDGTNEVQTLTKTGTVTGGTFTITYGTETTTAIPYNATAAQVQAYLEALDGVEPGDIVVTGGPLPTTALTLTFEGRLACQNVTAVTADATGLTGSTPGITVATPTPGSAGTVTLPDGRGLQAGTYRIRFTKRTTATAKSIQVDVLRPEHSYWERGQGFGVSGLSFGAMGEVNVDLTGLYVSQTDVNPGLTESFTTLDALPMRQGDFELDWLTGTAGTQEFSVSLANPLERGEDLGIRGYFPKVLEQTGEPTTLTGSISKRSVDIDDVNAAMEADTFAARASWITPAKIGATGTPYQLWLDMPACQLTGYEVEDVTNGRRFGASYEWVAAYDETAGYDFRFDLVCGVDAIETYA